MFDKNGTRLRSTAHTARPRRRPLCRFGPRRRRDGRTGRDGLKGMANQAFDQYIITRVEDILTLAGTEDAGYSRTVREVGAALDRLLGLARVLKSQYPQMTGFVMDFEALTSLESGQSAKIAYRQGLRDSRRLRREFMTFLQQ